MILKEYLSVCREANQDGAEILLKGVWINFLIVE